MQHLKTLTLINKNFLIWVLVFALILCGNIVYCFYLSASRSVLVLGATVSIVSAAVFFACVELHLRERLSTAAVIALLTFCSGLFYMIVFTPFTVPDEPYHFFSAYMYANRIMGLPTDPDNFMLREVDLEFFKNYYGMTQLNADGYRTLLDSLISSSNSGAIVPFDFSEIWPVWDLNTGEQRSHSWPSWLTNLPQYKIAPVLGILLARVLNFNGVLTFYMGRLFSLAFFSALAYVALRITPVGKRIFGVILLLPMTLHLAGSYSYDSPILGYSFVLIALYLKAIYTKKQIGRGHFVALYVFALLMVPCKPVYICICFLGFLVPRDRVGSRGAWLALTFGVLIASIAIVLLFKLSTLVGLTESAAIANRPGEKSYGLGDVVGNPLNTFAIFIYTLFGKADFYITSTVGGSLGWFQGNIESPLYLTLAFVVLLFVASLRVAHQTVRVTTRQRLVMGFIVAITLILTILTMLLDHTFISEQIVEGVQGRYLLPVAPLLLLAIQGRNVLVKKDPTYILCAIALLLNCLYLPTIFALALG